MVQDGGEAGLDLPQLRSPFTRFRSVMSRVEPATASTAPPAPNTGTKMYSYCRSPTPLVYGVSSLTGCLVSMTSWICRCSRAAKSWG